MGSIKRPRAEAKKPSAPVTVSMASGKNDEAGKFGGADDIVEEDD